MKFSWPDIEISLKASRPKIIDVSEFVNETIEFADRLKQMIEKPQLP